MATYAIGDVHGQFDALMGLLKKLHYHESSDELWFVGDLVNRGPHSLEVLQFIESLGNRVKVVLGNHDVSLLVQAMGNAAVPIKKSTREVLASKNSAQLLSMMRTWPLAVVDEERRIIMVHAGCFPQWTLQDIVQHNDWLCSKICDTNDSTFLLDIYHDEPRCWQENMSVIEKARFIMNVFTRMRFITTKGCLDLQEKTSPKQSPPGVYAWYELPRLHSYKIVFGHWAALGLKVMPQWACLDGGAGWSGRLVAFYVDSWKVAKTVAVSRGRAREKD